MTALKAVAVSSFLLASAFAAQSDAHGKFNEVVKKHLDKNSSAKPQPPVAQGTPTSDLPPPPP